MDWIKLAHQALECVGAFSLLCALVAVVCLSLGECAPWDPDEEAPVLPGPRFNRAQGDRLADREGRIP